MSILIKGMEMPTRCELCPIFNPEEDACSLIGETPWIWVDDETCETMHPRPDNCPLVPIPPHGDLIDRAELNDKIYHTSFCDPVVDWDDICHAPAIIEAESYG